MPAPTLQASSLAGVTHASALRAIAIAFDEAELFFGHGTGNAGDEAAWLVAWQGGIDYADEGWELAFDALMNAPVSATSADTLAQIANQRMHSRKPLAYLLGEAWFAGLRFIVTDDVLVPRSPIATLIADGFSPWMSPDETKSVLDIGTGSGCIAIASAFALPNARVDASDISPAALQVAAKNVALHGLQDRVRLIEADLLDSSEFKSYDVIVSNPPYVDQADMDARPAEYRHEPELGLAAGPDGLDLVRVMLAQAANYLHEDGVLIIEVGNSDEALQQEYAEVPFTWLSCDDDSRGVLLLTKAELQTHASLFAARKSRK